ncbi:MAG TPA: hypothetical protein VFD84_10035 [Candidatus Binatia bacterium]|nr:hypothetical protein [Candidatus Binatia bacterium]
MKIPRNRLLELALHVKLASEAMIDAARHLAALEPADTSAPERGPWAETCKDLLAMNVQLGFMERLLRRATRETAKLEARIDARSGTRPRL